MSIGFGIAVAASAFSSVYCEVHDKPHAAVIWFIVTAWLVVWNMK